MIEIWNRKTFVDGFSHFKFIGTGGTAAGKFVIPSTQVQLANDDAASAEQTGKYLWTYNFLNSESFCFRIDVIISRDESKKVTDDSSIQPFVGTESPYGPYGNNC